MKRIGLIAVLSIAMLATSCKKEKKETEVVKETVEVVKNEVATQSKKVTMKLEPKSDSKASGNVVFKEVAGTVSMTAVLGGLSEGTHAIHIHEKADCSSADGKSSGGHWNPTAQPHGKWGEATGYHKGDIGNFEADENGNGTITVSTTEWCIGCEDSNKDITGKAIIVHQGTDDFTSQPSGAAGARISCGGIIE
tara:strand:- start:1063 stop:1644 length:582 start_codon:yes stop_codon:yes gene_type:complete